MDPPAGYFLKSLAVAGGATTGVTTYNQFSNSSVDVKMDRPVTAITPVFAQYRKVTLADIPNATVTARGAFYPNSDGTGSTFTALSEKGVGYVYAELGKDPTVTLSVRDTAWAASSRSRITATASVPRSVRATRWRSP